jgi:hypothetical protein
MEERLADDFVASSILTSDLVVREAGTSKLSIIGTFQGFNAPTLPFVSPRFFIVVSITNFVKTPTALDVTANIVNPQTSQTFASVSGHIQLKEGVNIPRNGYLELAIPVPQVVFPSAGEYEIRILVNNAHAGSRYLVVKPQTSTQPA